MKFTSTIPNDITKNYIKNSFKDCLLNPVPLPDALWFPDNIQSLDEEFFENIEKLSFFEIAEKVLDNLLGEDIPKEHLVEIIKDSFNFDIPLVKCSDNMYILELFHGPTFTFKDVGARFMSRVLKFYFPEGTENFDIIVSTSGDTGSAVADAFQDLPNVKVHILYPKDLVSQVQEKQLTTYGKNVFAYEVEGNFDDCQDLIKKSLSDKELTDRLLFFPANSINIARLIPQSLYYFWAYAQLKKHTTKKPIICVPSGNLGNLSGGLLAHALGLPVKHFIGATNVNNTFEEYVNNDNSSLTNIKRATPTLSSAMDISLPNNLKRIQYVFKNKNINNLISSYSADDNETLIGIKEFYDKYKYTLDPHTSVGYIGVQKFIKTINIDNDNDPYIIISTAHPAKFYQTMNKTSVPYIMPEKISKLLELEGTKKKLKNDYNCWKYKLINNSYKSITFIGMPFSGKSFIGKHIANDFNFKINDIDKVIEDKYNMKLSDILKKYGTHKFKEIEEEAIIELGNDDKKSVIFSPGGSIVYSEKSINHLRKISKIVFLDVDINTLLERMKDFENEFGDTRGIVYEPGQNFTSLFEERLPLYEKYSDFKISCKSLNESDIVDLIFNDT